MQRNFSWENSEQDLTSENKEILTHTSQNTPLGQGLGRQGGFREQKKAPTKPGSIVCMCTSPLARVLCVTHEMPFVSFLCC